MNAAIDTRTQVRQRAGFACEYCGTSEIDSGGELTVDHYHPRSAGGDDSLANMIYCCFRCNLYKADYWPTQSTDVTLWNPRIDPIEMHLVLQSDRRLHPISAIGEFTLGRLRLNRPALIGRRLRRLAQQEASRLLVRYRDLLLLLVQANQSLDGLVNEQRKLLEQQRTLLQLLLRDDH